MSENYTVYMHRFPNGKVYIGMTSKKPEDRWKRGSGYRTQISMDGERLKVWECISDITRELGINSAHICACCRGQRNQTGGYRWMYADK